MAIIYSYLNICKFSFPSCLPKASYLSEEAGTHDSVVPSVFQDTLAVTYRPHDEWTVTLPLNSFYKLAPTPCFWFPYCSRFQIVSILSLLLILLPISSVYFKFWLYKLNFCQYKILKKLTDLLYHSIKGEAPLGSVQDNPISAFSFSKTPKKYL